MSMRAKRFARRAVRARYLPSIAAKNRVLADFITWCMRNDIALTAPLSRVLKRYEAHETTKGGAR